MLTTDDFIIQDYCFNSSPESCSDHSFSTVCMDIVSDEDFLTQLSSDLDIPLLLNPGEDELNMLNSLFDKSPEEILSDIKSPVLTMEDKFNEINLLKDLDLTTLGPDAFPNLQPEIKTEVESSSNSSSCSPKPSSPETRITIKEEVTVKTPPSSPESILTKIELSNNIIYTQPVQLMQGSLKQLPPKRVPIVPKAPYPLPVNKNNIMVINGPVPVTTSAENVVLLENLTTSGGQAKVMPVIVPPVCLEDRKSCTGLDPKALKRHQRKIRNRESASLSRKKKKDYITFLEDRIKTLSDENQSLKEENLNLKERLAECENKNENTNKSVKPGLFLCVFLLVVGVHLDFVRNPFSTNSQLDLVQRDSKILDHHRRNLLWTDEDDKVLKNNTDFSPLLMCPAMINQTETARLVLELERWIGKPESFPDSTKNATLLEKPVKSKLRKKRLKLDGSLVPAYKRYRFKNEHHLNPTPRNEMQVFSLRPEHSYSEFFEAINRQDDTYYVLSFTDQHMLLPALYHNKTRRPKMSLIMPSILLNGTMSQTALVPLMQIDCEVLDTKLIHVKHGSIPQHLRSYNNATRKDDSERKTSDKKYYKRPYKPYFINKPDREFPDLI